MAKIYFFNGWGMDRNLLNPVKNSSGYDIEVINFPYNIDKNTISKDDIFMGYSFGVYYLNKFLSENKDLKYKKSLGINGLPETIGKFGINEKMFNITLDTLNEENLEKFLINMDIDGSFCKSNKSFNDIKNELHFFKDNYKIIDNHIDFYYIGKKDRIIPGNKLEKYCQNNKLNYEIIECGHYPFSYFKDFKDILNV
ncbi:DUF452 family protein [Fusobacterium nucleatum]|uniref:pimeloyl-ACP methyl esterase BioG family protein n=1 Tax=Fusobacterium nucleatum TaxID=851 RepID=UPI003D052307